MSGMLLQAGAMILALGAMRPLLKRWMSGRMRFALWALPGLRMMLPWKLSFPTEIPIKSMTAAAATVLEGARRVEMYLQAGRRLPLREIWATGAVVALIYVLWRNVAQGRRIRRMVPAGTWQGIEVYRSGAEVPCLFGVLRPKILLPGDLDGGIEKMALIHEGMHYRRGDHIWTSVRVGLLCAYWWNPLVWLAARWCAEDCEAACDQAVAREMDREGVKAYCAALIAMASERTWALPALSGTAKSIKTRILLMKRGEICMVKKVFSLILVVCLMMGMCALAQEEPTLGVIGGADGPTRIWVSGDFEGKEMYFIGRFPDGECVAAVSLSDESFHAQMDEMLDGVDFSTGILTGWNMQEGEEFLLLSRPVDGEMQMIFLYCWEGQEYLRCEEKDALAPEGMYDLVNELLDRMLGE